MFPPKLTKEQKEHSKEASRANAHVGNTWSLFCMFLEHGKSPSDALRLAEEAMDVWIPWEDGKVVEYPDIDSPDIVEGIQVVMRTAMEEAERRKAKDSLDAGVVLGVGEVSTDVDAEFTTEGPKEVKEVN